MTRFLTIAVSILTLIHGASSMACTELFKSSGKFKESVGLEQRYTAYLKELLVKNRDQVDALDVIDRLVDKLDQGERINPASLIYGKKAASYQIPTKVFEALSSHPEFRTEPILRALKNMRAELKSSAAAQTKAYEESTTYREPIEFGIIRHDSKLGGPIPIALVINNLGLRYIEFLSSEQHNPLPKGQGIEGHWFRIAQELELQYSFELMKAPVTNVQWKDLMGSKDPLFFYDPKTAKILPDPIKAEDVAYDNHPVAGISWKEAMEFANRLSIESGLEPAYVIGEAGRLQLAGNVESLEGYRIPTASEQIVWTARMLGELGLASGDNIKPDQLMAHAWLGINSQDRVHRVRLKTPSTIDGAEYFDLIGNMPALSHFDFRVNDIGELKHPENGYEQSFLVGGVQISFLAHEIKLRWDHVDDRLSKPVYYESRVPLGLRLVRTLK